MSSRGPRILAAAPIVALLIGLHAASAQPGQSGRNAGAAAKVGHEVITQQELEQAAKAELAKLEEQRYAILEQKLEQLIGEKLLAQEAARRNLSLEQLLKTEVYGKAADVPESEVTAFIQQNRSRLPRGGDETDLRLRVWDHLRSQRVAQQRQSYLEALRTQGKVTVLLEEPVAARVSVSDRGFARGPQDAPVTIVEFSDFQCPFCKNVTATLKQLLDKYPGKVRWVFRDYPIVGLHPGAPKVHEAARCAGEQGKFWEYHDLVFERSPRHSAQELKQYAQELKLDPAAFAQCVDTAKYQAAVDQDVQEGSRLGVSGTPTFYINGRQLVGAQPITAFQKLIDGELARKASQ